MAQIVRPFLATLGIVFIAGAAADLMSLAYPFLLQRLVDSLARSGRFDDIDAPAGLAILVVGLCVTGALATAARDFVSIHLSARVGTRFASIVIGKILRQPFLDLRRKPAGEWMTALQQIQDLKLALGLMGTQAVFALLLVVGYIAILFSYDSPVGLLYVVLSGTTIAGLLSLGRGLSLAVERGYQDKAQADTLFAEALRSPVVVRSFGLSAWIERKWAGRHEDSIRHFRKADACSVCLSAGFDLLRQSVPLLVLMWKLGDVRQGRLTFGAALAIATVFGQGFDPFLKLTTFFTHFQKALSSARALGALARLGEEDIRPREMTRAAPITPGLEVRARGVSFRYPTRQRDGGILNVDLEARPGERVALVGRSGSGKTTFLHLLLRLFDHDKGEIFLDGEEIKRMPLSHLRGRIGLVSQDVELFSGSVLENIALGDERPDVERAERSAALARACEFITRLPDGLNTRLGNGGASLSAGQKQRLSLARALYRRPALLLLDEPTSALDALTESEVARALASLGSECTIIVTAHRLRTVVDFDRIYVFDSGSVVESGTHAELLARGGLYEQLFETDGGPASN